MPRPRLEDSGGTQPKKYKRSVPTNAFRLAVVEFIYEFGMSRTLERYYPGVVGTQRETKRKNIHLWARRREAIGAAGANKRRKRDAGTGATLPRDVEYKLLRWINDLRSLGAPISAAVLSCKANKL